MNHKGYEGHDGRDGRVLAWRSGILGDSAVVQEETDYHDQQEGHIDSSTVVLHHTVSEEPSQLADGWKRPARSC
ncbi:hypothetical protein [Botrimarina mediterranea]|uniref:hypothetical protein n=1 Tax=Botrimarina mediterranea TaxID=2528022 RepID=UPI00119F4E33|nr:hypothetical protein [Botrimarina mediterranea]